MGKIGTKWHYFRVLITDLPAQKGLLSRDAPDSARAGSRLMCWASFHPAAMACFSEWLTAEIALKLVDRRVVNGQSLEDPQRLPVRFHRLSRTAGVA